MEDITSRIIRVGIIILEGVIVVAMAEGILEGMVGTVVDMEGMEVVVVVTAAAAVVMAAVVVVMAVVVMVDSHEQILC